MKLPCAFSIVAGPLGDRGRPHHQPHLRHGAAIRQHRRRRDGGGRQTVGLSATSASRRGPRRDPTANTNPQPVDFYSPDTFNFTVLDVSADGRTLSVKSVGMDATTQNAGIDTPTVRSRERSSASRWTRRQRSAASRSTMELTKRAPVKPHGRAGRHRAQASIAPGAFTLTARSGLTVGVNSVSSIGRDTFITLGFAAPASPDGSLPDGTFTLNIDRNKIPVDAACARCACHLRTLFGISTASATTIDAKGASWNMGSNAQIFKRRRCGQFRIALRRHASVLGTTGTGGSGRTARALVILGQASPLPPGRFRRSPEGTMIPPANQIFDTQSAALDLRRADRSCVTEAPAAAADRNCSGRAASSHLRRRRKLGAWQPSSSTWVKFGPLRPTSGRRRRPRRTAHRSA